MGQYVPLEEDELGFLNNFFCHFRFGVKMVMPDGFYRTTSASHWNITFRQYMEKELEDMRDCLMDYFSTRSDKKLAQTPAEFYVEVDRTVAELGLDSESIAGKISNYKNNQQDPRVMENMKNMNAYLKPVYAALRQKGYNKADLWC